MKKNKYRFFLEKLRNKSFRVIARVESRSTKPYTSKHGNTYKIDTMLLKNISCIIDGEEVAYINHTWLSAECNKIVHNFNIKPGCHIEFIATVNDYKYSHGAKQLGLIQLGTNFKIIGY